MCLETIQNWFTCSFFAGVPSHSNHPFIFSFFVFGWVCWSFRLLALITDDWLWIKAFAADAFETKKVLSKVFYPFVLQIRRFKILQPPIQIGKCKPFCIRLVHHLSHRWRFCGLQKTLFSKEKFKIRKFPTLASKAAQASWKSKQTKAGKSWNWSGGDFRWRTMSSGLFGETRNNWRKINNYL